MHAGAIDPSRRHLDLLYGHAGERLLGSMVWMHVVMYRPVLLPTGDVVRRVEELAGHLADLLAVRHDPIPEHTAVTAANTLLDECCSFLERWGAGDRDADEFDTAVRRLRVRLDGLARSLVRSGALAS